MKNKHNNPLVLPEVKEKSSGLNIHIALSPAKVTEVYDSYWKFAALRQDVFFNRFEGKPAPWSEDPVLNEFKFTNAYRASDRVSQYLINKVIYNEAYSSEPLEVLFRILLFKLFNKIETWELLSDEFGTLSYEAYSFKHYNRVLSEAMDAKETIYSAAYIMPSGGSYFGLKRKHSNHLKLIEKMLEEQVHDKLMSAHTMQQAYETIKSYPGLGDFLAYQLTIDVNYSTLTSFSESSFVVPGPGAKGGISKCFLDTGGLNNVELIKMMTDRQDLEFERLELEFKDLWGRPLQLIDCQNLFCEVDKYARVMHPEIKGKSDRVRIKQKFKSNSTGIEYSFPPKWGINERIRGVMV